MSFIDKYKVIDRAQMSGVAIEILEMRNLEGAKDPEMAKQMYYAEQQGLKVRMITAKLNNAGIKTEAGSLYFSTGNIKGNVPVGGVTGLVKKKIASTLTEESFLKPEYNGTGEIFFEPSFKHYYMIKLDNNSIIIDKSLFYCCSSDLDLSVVPLKSISSMALGNEGLFQLEVKGTGVLVLELSVPINEILVYDLKNGPLKVDGNFVFARSSKSKFTVTKSNKGLIKSAMGGEGLLNTYTGEGKVWLAPTAPMYKRLFNNFDINNININNLE